MGEKDIEDENSLNEQINILHTEFDIVLITERFYESLVVMKEELCWNLQDILFLKVLNFNFYDFMVKILQFSHNFFSVECKE